MKHIVKRGRHAQAYDERKLYASIYAACLSVRVPAGTAELVSAQAVGAVNNWLTPKHEVTANDIRRVAHKYLKVLNQDAAYMYLHHRVVW